MGGAVNAVKNVVSTVSSKVTPALSLAAPFVPALGPLSVAAGKVSLFRSALQDRSPIGFFRSAVGSPFLAFRGQARNVVANLKARNWKGALLAANDRRNALNLARSGFQEAVTNLRGSFTSPPVARGGFWRGGGNRFTIGVPLKPGQPVQIAQPRLPDATIMPVTPPSQKQAIVKQ